MENRFNIDNTEAHNKELLSGCPTKTGLYIIYMTNGIEKYVKLGYSTNLRTRLSNHANYPFVYIIGYKTMYNALEVERKFHRDNTSVKGNEWYDISKIWDMMKLLEMTPRKRNYEDTLNNAVNNKVITSKEMIFVKSEYAKSVHNMSSRQFKYLNSIISRTNRQLPKADRLAYIPKSKVIFY